MGSWSLGAWLVLVLSAGCATTQSNRRVLTQPARNPPAILEGETEADVRSGWGEPDRILRATDEQTGKSVTVWQYDRYTDTNGSKLLTSVSFDDAGKVSRVEQSPVTRGREPLLIPRDSAARRDMGP